MTTAREKRVLVLINPKSGLYTSFSMMRRAFDAAWEKKETEIFYQFCQSRKDGIKKAKRAVEDKFDSVLVAGGDGTVSTIGRILVSTDVSLGVIPTGSGNGFARHFGIPLWPEKAVRALAESTVKQIDVGVVNETPFFITCSMAWDAALVRSFEQSPIRGIVPYIFAGVKEFLEYKPQKIDAEIDGAETVTFPDPMVFTIANLTQYGAGARIAPQAEADDGYLELVSTRHQDVPKLIANIGMFFAGSVDKIPEVETKRFKKLRIRREHEAPIQVDGELIEASQEINVKVIPGALKVLVPGEK
ncbi:diacylglycerol/lipid kinase family protein [Verrucomicrobiota bacterium]